MSCLEGCCLTSKYLGIFPRYHSAVSFQFNLVVVTEEKIFIIQASTFVKFILWFRIWPIFMTEYRKQ